VRIVWVYGNFSSILYNEVRHFQRNNAIFSPTGSGKTTISHNKYPSHGDNKYTK
jgi:hypothetical protein